MDSHPNSSTVHVGDYEYNTRDLIGHGAFAVVFKGRHRKVIHLVITFHSFSHFNQSINNAHQMDFKDQDVRPKHVLIKKKTKNHSNGIKFGNLAF